MMIRTATIDDLDDINNLEKICFPENEVASFESFKERLNHFPNHFWLLYEENVLVSLIDGLCTNIEDLSDEMFDNAEMHDENGDWQMILGVCTHPDYRNRGYSSILMNHVIDECRLQNRRGIVLTCKESLLSFYKKLGFVDEGLSDSDHGGVSWNQVRLKF